MQELFTFLVVFVVAKTNGDPGDFRPPAIPLIVFSPHVSVWSFSDNLTGSDTVHWTGSPLGFHGLIDIDNSQTYRFLGTLPSNISTLIQNKVVVQPWRTIYTFSTPTNILELVLIFSQPTSIQDPYTYITFDVRSLDQKTHNVRIYFDQDSTLSIYDKGEKVYWNRTDGDITVLTMDALNQIPFGLRGDYRRNNWGYAHLISGNKSITTGYQAFGDDSRQAFANHQSMPNDDTRKPRHADDQLPTSAFIINLGQVSSQTISSYVVFLYDDVYSMLYFNEWQPPCWRAELNNDITLLINESISYYESNMADITDSNQLLMTLLTKVGGEQYSLLGSLVTRQITGSLTRTWSDRYNRSQLYMKEISSGGAISTVDVIFPSSPFFLWLHPEILRDLLIPVLAYGNNETNDPYNLTWAPHHLGVWPVCDILPTEQEQMPVEESANMLLMLAAIVQRLNTTDFLKPYWNVMEIWAQYLNSSLPDPGNQLCTDDFEGPSPHNVNLALKGILSLGAYALLLNSTGETQRAAIYMNQAQDFVNYWLKAARDNEHYRLQYDLPNTWSQKYNLVYQSILSLNLFPSDVAKLESDYYMTKMLDFGIPLDSRSNLTKSDWTSWIAAFNGDKQKQDAIIEKLYRFANESPNRVPFSDIYNAATGHVIGARARPVMGGLFIRALLESPLVKDFHIKSKSPSKRPGRIAYPLVLDMQEIFAFLIVLLITKINGDPGDFRPPAVPLIVFSPHISVWSFSDSLTDSNTIHWSGSPLGFHGLIDIDNSQTYRFLGTLPSTVPALAQNKVVVQPWRTIYTFSTPTNTLELILTFSQPISIDDPYTYITFDVRSLDQKTHNVRIYFDQGSMLAINITNEKVYWNRIDGDVIVLTMNGYDQIPFRINGDAPRNNWGYAHLISGNKSITSGYQGFGDDLRQAFANHQSMPSDDTRKPRHADDHPPTSAFIINLGQVSSQTISSYVVFLYDDVYSMLYFNEWQPPCWRAELNNDVTLLINESISYYGSNMADITESNQLLMTKLTRVAGEQYSLLGSLVTRQVTGALTRTWSDRYNRSQLYMKEISSDGATSTIDVIYPSSPFFLWLYPEMLRDLLIPILAYINNETCVGYSLKFAPHHLGTWPICDRLETEQTHMQMEESGNMFLMLAGVVQKLNNTDFLKPYWNVMEIWVQYLNSTLPDPGNQLCIDNFEGPSPHNVNLALKGILGLGAYALLLNFTGQTQRATIYMNQAQDFANYWLKAARDNEHYRLQYDLPNTWSQKYNLVYQSILSLNLFPSDVAKLESDYYMTQMLDFGIPLDSRSNLTKSDWTSWIAAFNGDKQQQDAIIGKLHKFANESPDRVPFSDLYDAATGRVLGFRARPVMGGLFVRALLETPLVEDIYIKSKSPRKRHGRVNKCDTS